MCAHTPMDAGTNGGAEHICPDVAVTGLQSAAACFDVVELLCYQTFVSEYLKKRIPSLRVLHASDYMSEEEFTQKFREGVGLRTLADIVRARRLLHRRGGWFVGCDCHWIKRIGTIDMKPPRVGYCLRPWTIPEIH